MKTKRKLLTPILGGLILVLVVLMVMASKRKGPPFVPPPVPSPNGFEDLYRAAKMLAPRTGFFDEMELEELEQVVSQNQAALDIARKALDLQIVIPTDWTIDPATGLQVRLDEPQKMRDLCRAFVAESRLRQEQEDPDAACDTLLDGFKLGTKALRDGLIIDFMVGVAIQTVTTEELKSLVEQNPALGQKVMSEMLTLQKATEPAEAVINREIDYINSATSGFSGWMMRRQLDALMGPSVDATREVELRAAAHQNLFLTHLAVDAYQRQHSALPKTLDEVKTKVLPNLPIDPYAKAPFIYRVTDDGYQLYSVGSNKTDDGGQGDATGKGLDFVYDFVPTE